MIDIGLTAELSCGATDSRLRRLLKREVRQLSYQRTILSLAIVLSKKGISGLMQLLENPLPYQRYLLGTLRFSNSLDGFYLFALEPNR